VACALATKYLFLGADGVFRVLSGSHDLQSLKEEAAMESF
jgi:hypothetical protein